MRRVAVGLVLCVLASGVGAQSPQEGPPAPSVSTEPKGEAAGNQPAAQPQNAPPPPVIVNVQPPAKTEAEAEDEKRERQEKAGLDRRLVELTADLANYTKWLAYATIILTIATAGLFAFAIKQAFDARDVGRAARDSADAAKRSADVAEAALIGAEAPFIFATAERLPIYRPIRTDGSAGFASFTLHNYGRSPAVVRDVYPGSIRCVGLPAPIRFPPPHSAVHQVQVIPAGGQNEPWNLREDAFVHPGWHEGAEPDPNASHWIIGQVRYSDPFGTQYVTGFCFAYNAFTKRFYGQGGTAYNYRRRLTEEETRQAQAMDAEMPPFFERQSDEG